MYSKHVNWIGAFVFCHKNEKAYSIIECVVYVAASLVPRLELGVLRNIYFKYSPQQVWGQDCVAVWLSIETCNMVAFRIAWNFNWSYKNVIWCVFSFLCLWAIRLHTEYITDGSINASYHKAMFTHVYVSIVCSEPCIK